MPNLTPNPEQLKNGFLLSVATIFAISGAGFLNHDPVLGTLMLISFVWFSTNFVPPS